MMNNKRVPTMMSYQYISLIFLTVLTAKITFASTLSSCTLSSNQISLQAVTVVESADLDKVKFEFSINDPSTFTAYIYICLKENGASLTQPCLWQELTKSQVTAKASSLEVVVEKEENVDCANNCLVKWVLKQSNSNPKEYAGCKRVDVFEVTASFSGHSTISTSSTSPTPDLTTILTTSATTIKSSGNCNPVGVYKSVPGMQQWCTIHCAAGFCPSSHCVCGSNSMTCEPTTIYRKVLGMKEWCQTNCLVGHCPSTHCICSRGSTP